MSQNKWMIWGCLVAARQNVIILLVWLLAFSHVSANAEPVQKAAASELQTDTAYQVVETITTELLALIEDAKQYVDEDEERFFSELDVLLRPFIDFRSFARAVMGRHASSKKMASLNDIESGELNAQIDRFSEIFLGALIQTYGEGLLAFEGETIEVVVPEKGPDATKPQPKKVVVKQLIYGDRQTPYEVKYLMRKDSQGQWRLRNMVVESINLGKIYRNQFDNAYQVYEGDIDRVIDNWVVSGAPEAAAMNN